MAGYSQPQAETAPPYGAVFSMEEADVQRRFGGLERLYGVPGAARIRAAHVVVVGVGGVGSWTAEALARSGVSRLTLIDMDHVAESNINRQIHALTSTVGQAKIEAMRDRIAEINPACVVNCIDEFVDPDNWQQLLPVDADAVIDACDQIKAKAEMAAHARKTRQCFISVGAAGGKRMAHLVDIADLVATTHDPLLSQLRYRLRKQHGAPKDGKRMGVTCVFSREAVAPPDASCSIEGGDGSLNCHGYGSVVAVTATFGQCAAGWVLDQLARQSN
ncbi:heme biosynthesis protein HemY [Comamonas testosteroni TK102]|uniref:Heme biosynthesis protein HemY n=1 Tax=Comamonas testosteroni TK102 TaxID=1392005 RepID=A0A076PKC1_COMTE|nr:MULTISPECIES: tRNA threonylcarbamoyladenosine dehydratase [Comamonas]AIJ46103.1 heme biosynthesis protein HemY [Comamonas testosteroni TK102]MPS88683.1 tRNA threonylcarbamoyladenosine dehydratase [Comamonas sp.]